MLFTRVNCKIKRRRRKTHITFTLGAINSCAMCKSQRSFIDDYICFFFFFFYIIAADLCHIAVYIKRHEKNPRCEKEEMKNNFKCKIEKKKPVTARNTQPQITMMSTERQQQFSISNKSNFNLFPMEKFPNESRKNVYKMRLPFDIFRHIFKTKNGQKLSINRWIFCQSFC